MKTREKNISVSSIKKNNNDDKRKGSLRHLLYQRSWIVHMFFDIKNRKYVVYLLGTPGLIEKVYRKTSKY